MWFFFPTEVATVQSGEDLCLGVQSTEEEMKPGSSCSPIHLWLALHLLVVQSSHPWKDSPTPTAAQVASST
jgi:hypothetical protein